MPFDDIANDLGTHLVYTASQRLAYVQRGGPEKRGRIGVLWIPSIRRIILGIASYAVAMILRDVPDTDAVLVYGVAATLVLFVLLIDEYLFLGASSETHRGIGTNRIGRCIRTFVSAAQSQRSGGTN
jgi:hypothetical protein